MTVTIASDKLASMKSVTGLLVASMVVGTLGCASTSPSRENLQVQIAAYQRALAERDQRLAHLSYQTNALARGQAVLAAHVERARRAEQLVTQKLEELIELDSRIETQLGTTPQPDVSALEQQQTALVNQLREAHTARNQAMKELGRTVQYLIETGQLHVTTAGDRAPCGAQRTLDVEDPWRYR